MTGDRPRLRHLEEQARGIGRLLKARMPHNAGFILLLFDFGEGGWTTYVSSAHRADCIKLLREFLARLESEQS